MTDYMVRATAAEGQIRAFAATSRETVETARKNHNTSPVATAALGKTFDSRSDDGQHDEGGEGPFNSAD